MGRCNNQQRMNGGRSLRAWLLFCLLCCVLPATGAAAEVQVRAEMNPVKFAEDRAARFTIIVTGAAGSAEPAMPAADGLYFTYQGQSSQTSWINGRISSSVSYNFLVQAEKTGEFTIAPIKVTVGGKVYTSDPVNCTVLPAQGSVQAGGNPQAQGKAGTPDAGPDPGEAEKIGFLRIMPESERMYSGQIVPFTVKFYVRSGMESAIQGYSAPKFVGEDFLQHSLDEQAKQGRERFNGQLFTTLTWQGTFSGVKEGTVPLLAEMYTAVKVRTRTRRRVDPSGSSLFDDPFFADILGGGATRKIQIPSPEKMVTVLDLPAENRPDDFSGAVGSFSLSATASPLDGKVGDPVTMKMRLEGSGNFAAVQAPALTESQGWKVYPASGTVTDLGGGKGEKVFEQALIPMQGGLAAVPLVRFSYFDPKTEDYVTLTSDPIPLSLQAADESVASKPGTSAAPPESGSVLKEGPAGDPQTAAEKDAAAQPVQHIAPLKPELGELVPSLRPLYHRLWFQVLMIAALFCLLAALLLFLRQRKLAGDPSILRRKQVRGRLAGHYEAMKKAVADQDHDAFCLHCRAAIQQRTGEVWGLAPESVTLADLEQRLPEEARLRAVFSRLEQSGYAGEQLAQADLEEILQTTRNELEKPA